MVEQALGGKTTMSTITITISVTQSDIDNGKRGDCWLCPVAMALWRATGWKWIVGGYGPDNNNTGAYPVGHKNERCDLPIKALSFMADFDDEQTTASVRPFEFEMQVPEWVMVRSEVGV